MVKFGSSRPCGCNHHKSSIHAEEDAIRYCLKHKNKNYKIIIWKWGRDGKVREKHCCHGCTKIIKKYGYENNIFTIIDNQFVSAIEEFPEVSLTYKIRNENIYNFSR